MWGDFLQFVTPSYVSHYEYVAIVLDDIFLPDQGPNKFNATKMISDMETYAIDVMQPGTVGDTWNILKHAKDKNLDSCIGEVDMIETYVQIFSRDAWDCFYDLLDYRGSRGWCYDICFKKECPDLKLAMDFSMAAYHMDKGHTELPQDLVKGTSLEGWHADTEVLTGSKNGTYAICKMHDCGFYPFTDVRELACPSDQASFLQE